MLHFLIFLHERDTGQERSFPGPTSSSVPCAQNTAHLLAYRLQFLWPSSQGRWLRGLQHHPSSQAGKRAGGESGVGLQRLARETRARKAGRAGCPGARLGQVTWRQIGLLLTHASHQYPEPAWRGISKQSHNWVLLRPCQNTQAHISNRRVINLIGPSSRISAFWQASAGAEEVRGQVWGSAGRRPLQPDTPECAQSLSCISCHARDQLCFLLERKAAQRTRRGHNSVPRAQPEIYTRVACQTERKPGTFQKCLTLSLSAKRNPTFQCSCQNL